jgi:selenoprotein W-related protein
MFGVFNVQAKTTSVIIHYCTQCQWQLRSVWMAQELLASFSDELYQITLRPGTGGVFEIWVNDTLVWERKRDKGFPSAKELKLRVRNIACPDKILGAHTERASTDSPSATE